MSLYNIIDRMVIGHVVGPEAIAGLTVTFPVMNIATAIGVLVGGGSAARVSILLGSDNHKAAQRVLGNALSLTLVNGAIYITLLAVFLDDIKELFTLFFRELFGIIQSLYEKSLGHDDGGGDDISRERASACLVHSVNALALVDEYRCKRR